MNTRISKGRIAVYTAEHKLMESKLYYTSEGMKNIMADFMGLEEADYIRVRPYENEENNVYRLPIFKRHIVSDEVKEKLVRPPAVYNNSKTYKYD